MYIIRDNSKGEHAILKDKTQVSAKIKCSVQTIRNHKGEKEWDFGVFTVITPNEMQLKSNRGRFSKGGFK